MITIQCKEHQLWSADPIKAMKAFYDCQTRQICTQKKDFENECTDDRHWATDLNDVREAFYEYFGQVKMSNRVFAPFKKHMHKSLYADFEKTIERLKKCLENFICDTQLNQLLESNTCRLSCFTNKKAYECGDTFEEFNESLLNDQCNIINVLVNRLKMCIDDDAIFKLLDVKSSDQDKSSNCLEEYIYKTIKKIVASISFSSCKKAVKDKPIDCRSQTKDSGEKLTLNKSECRPICKSQTEDCKSGGDLTVDNYKTRPMCETQVSDGNCCEDNTKLKYELAEMEKIKNQLLCEKRLKEIAGYKLLLAMRKSSLNIKRENKLSYY